MYHHLPSLCFVLAAVGHRILVAADTGFDRQQCYGKVMEIMNSSNSSITMDPSIFITGSDAANPILTLNGCQQLCGSGTGWYPDAVSRLVTWLLPVILLVSNMQFASIGMERFLLIPRLLGDPIDSTWSLLMKVDHWNRCFSHARSLVQEKIEIKSLATILAATDGEPHEFDHQLVLSNPRDKSLLVETGLALAENRSHELLRTVFAIAIYAFSVLAAFVPKIGESSSPSGGKIGTAMLLSWLLPVVLLSNAIGDFGSLRNCRRITTEFMERLGRQSDLDSWPSGVSTLNLSFFGVHLTAQTSHEASEAWSGAIYCYRPGKRYSNASGWKLALISVFPVAIAFGTAFGVLDTGPVYFSCRHRYVIIIFSFWLISAFLTSLLSYGSLATGKFLLYIVLIKDTVFAITNLAMIIASCWGLGNTCYCWSGALVHGEKGARAQLNPQNIFDLNDNVIYPAMVATCLCFQVCVFGFMLWVGWAGFRALWWSEDEKRKASRLRRSIRMSSTATQVDMIGVKHLGDSRIGKFKETPQ